jgi:hypothetical protein
MSQYMLIASYQTWDDLLTWHHCRHGTCHESEEDHRFHVHLDEQGDG